jgi:hypothetical protein
VTGEASGAARPPRLASPAVVLVCNAKTTTHEKLAQTAESWSECEYLGLVRCQRFAERNSHLGVAVLILSASRDRRVSKAMRFRTKLTSTKSLRCGDSGCRAKLKRRTGERAGERVRERRAGAERADDDEADEAAEPADEAADAGEDDDEAEAEAAMARARCAAS